MKNPAKELWSRAAALLSGEPTPEDAQEMIRDIAGRLAEVEARQIVINADGSERRKALEAGSPADLVALDKELESLRAEEVQLRFRSSELHKRMRIATAERGVRNAGRYRRELVDAVIAAEKANTIFQAALAKAQQAATTITEARFAAQAIDHPGSDDCYADPASAAQLGALVHPVDLDKRFAFLLDLSPPAARQAHRHAQDQRVGRLRGKESGSPLF